MKNTSLQLWQIFCMAWYDGSAKCVVWASSLMWKTPIYFTILCTAHWMEMTTKETTHKSPIVFSIQNRMIKPHFLRYTGIKHNVCTNTWLFSPLCYDSWDRSPDSSLSFKLLGRNQTPNSRRLRRLVAQTPCRGVPRSACRRTSAYLQQAHPPHLWWGRRRRPRTDRGPEGILGIGERPSRSSPSVAPGWRTEFPGRWPAAVPSVDLEALFSKQRAVTHTQSSRCLIFLMSKIRPVFTSKKAVKGI